MAQVTNQQPIPLSMLSWMSSTENLQNITFNNYPAPKYQMRNPCKQQIARPKLLVGTTQSRLKNLKLYRFVVETPDSPARDIAQGYRTEEYEMDIGAGVSIIAKDTKGVLPCDKSILPLSQICLFQSSILSSCH
jgi:hypothetical protein